MKYIIFHTKFSRHVTRRAFFLSMTKRDIESTNPDTTVEKETKMTKASQVTSLLVKKLVPQAQLPARGSAFSAGYDLFSVEKKTIAAGDKALIDLGISISVPAGTYGRVAPRSGLGVYIFTQ